MMHEVENSLDQFRVGHSYETLEFIGYGSSGVIYKGKNISQDTPVAIKILNPELAKNEQFIQVLNSEIKAIVKLNHPNIVKVKETGKENDKFFIIMEYVEGESLEKILNEKRKLSLYDSIDLLKQLALAIDYANSNQVIHKAIKPKNILVTEDNHLKLAGFGLSKAMSTAWLTMTSAASADVEYMSPEQAEGENIDHRCDIYAFGIIAYQLLTGEVPFKKDGNSILNLAMKHINVIPERPRLKNSSISPALENIILRCLEKNPVKRFQSGQEILDALKNESSKDLSSLLDTKVDMISQTQIITAEELRKSLANNNLGKEVLQSYNDKAEVSFQKEKNESEHGNKTVNSVSKDDASHLSTLKNQKQLKLMLFTVILLELVIISIFVFILVYN